MKIKIVETTLTGCHWLSCCLLDLRCEQILGHSSHHFRSQKCPSWLFKMQYNLVLRNHKSSGQLVLFKFCTSSIALTWPRNNSEHVKVKAMNWFSYSSHLISSPGLSPIWPENRLWKRRESWLVQDSDRINLRIQRVVFFQEGDNFLVISRRNVRSSQSNPVTLLCDPNFIQTSWWQQIVYYIYKHMCVTHAFWNKVHTVLLP